MEVRLIIALDDQCQIYKTLIQGELQEIDTYMVSHYESSDEVRNDPKLKPIIDSFLQEHQHYRDACSRKNNGYIRVVYTDEKGQICPLKAYYKKDKNKLSMRHVKAKIKRDGTEDVNLLRSICKKYHSTLSKYAIHEIEYGLRFHFPSCYKAVFSNWVESISKQEDGYFQIRQLNRYIEKYQDVKKKLPSTIHTNSGQIDEISQELLTQDVSLSMQEPDFVRCVKAAEDPDELFAIVDLDDLVHTEPEDIPSYVKRTKR